MDFSQPPGLPQAGVKKGWTMGLSCISLGGTAVAEGSWWRWGSPWCWISALAGSISPHFTEDRTTKPNKQQLNEEDLILAQKREDQGSNVLEKGI